jgi:hypothetical protein
MINNELKERMETLLNSREDWTVDELNQEMKKIVMCDECAGIVYRDKIEIVHF